MTNEELTVLIQGGERDRLIELWQQIRRMVLKEAGRWAAYHSNGVETAIATLPPELQAAVRGRYFYGAVVDSKAHDRAMRLLRAPKCSRALREYL